MAKLTFFIKKFGKVSVETVIEYQTDIPTFGAEVIVHFDDAGVIKSFEDFVLVLNFD
jgi:hypothetical protein